MEEDAGSENGSPPVVTGVGGEDPMDEIVADPDPEFDNSATGTGKGADEVISLDSDDEDGGDAGTGAGKDGVEAGSVVMKTEGLLVTTRVTLTNDNDKDAMSVKDSKTEVAENTKANTTGIKSIATLNATGVVSVWSLPDRISRTVVSASVASILWRPTKTYKSTTEIEKAISELLPEVWTSVSPTIKFSLSLSVSDLTEFVSTIAHKKQPWLLCVTFTPSFFLYRKHLRKYLARLGLRKMNSFLHLPQQSGPLQTKPSAPAGCWFIRLPPPPRAF